jgi:hypothetical protein
MESILIRKNQFVIVTQKKSTTALFGKKWRMTDELTYSG